MRLVSPPVKFSESKPSIRSPPPTLGQHTDEVLADLLGMDKTDITALKQAGVVA
jgi:succinate--hydroxymethylglutarate CoA-transferase